MTKPKPPRPLFIADLTTSPEPGIKLHYQLRFIEGPRGLSSVGEQPPEDRARIIAERIEHVKRPRRAN